MAMAYLDLEVTGKLDSSMVKVIQRPRCSVLDVAKCYLFPGEPKWKKDTLTCKSLSHAEVGKAVERGLQAWSNVALLNFVRTSTGEAGILILFESGDHGDSYHFNSPCGTVAHTFAPSEGLGGDTHSDNFVIGENFTFSKNLWTRHCRRKSGLGKPQWLQHPTKPSNPGHCDPSTSFSAVTGLGKEIIFFRNRTKLMSKADAAYEVAERGVACFFKDRSFLKKMMTQGFQMQGPPCTMPDFGFSGKVQLVDAVVYLKDEKETLFFVVHEYYSYDDTRKMGKDCPKHIGEVFVGTSNKIDAAVEVNGEYLTTQQMGLTVPVIPL
uniref:Matrix metallopeptidase 20 n=1 Tax=Dromaius novaehollandiae TaxID=8790 RepID=A0A8C4KMG4_DRONO